MKEQVGVTLLHHTPIWVANTAIRTCWNSHDKSDAVAYDLLGNIIDDTLHNCISKGVNDIVITEKDKELIDTVSNKYKHSSTIEHVSYNFYLKGVPRNVLQELARHRIASLSVKSSRYTLKELKHVEPFITASGVDREEASKYIYMTGDTVVDDMGIIALENLRKLVVKGKSNDIIKFAMPESYLTELTWTINARSLQNFLSLRLDKSALWAIRDLAQAIYDAIPADHKFIYEEQGKKYV